MVVMIVVNSACYASKVSLNFL